MVRILLFLLGLLVEEELYSVDLLFDFVTLLCADFQGGTSLLKLTSGGFNLPLDFLSKLCSLKLNKSGLPIDWLPPFGHVVLSLAHLLEHLGLFSFLDLILVFFLDGLPFVHLANFSLLLL